MIRFSRFTRSPQLGLLFWGMLANSIGLSLIWPFLVINIRERLDVPLTSITTLFTLQSVAGIAATTLLGPLMDRVGRKGPMIGGLVGSGIVLLLMAWASILAQWTLLMVLYGMVIAVFRIGAYSMAADLTGANERADVYALLRTGDNVGVAVGPALGGLLATAASSLTYILGALSQAGLAVAVALVLRETLARPASTSQPTPRARGLGYGPLLRDRPFLAMWGLYILVQVASVMVFMLLGLYVKENYGINEDRFGLMITVNALMVVFLQYAVTQLTDRHPPLPMLALGGLVYAAGMAVFALGRSFAVFLGGMVIFTVGELILAPTGTALAANLAPPDMRARYMGMFALSFRVAAGFGPVIGGVLSDQIAPVATWYGGLAFCLAAVVGFMVMARRPAFTVTGRETAHAAAPGASGDSS